MQRVSAGVAFAHLAQDAQLGWVGMGNASVDRSNVAGQRLKTAGKAERNVNRKRFAIAGELSKAIAGAFS